MDSNVDFEENEILELKKSTSELKEAIISIAAILNKHRKGELYFGIKNDGTVVGQDVGEQTIRDVSKAISDNIEPRIYPMISRIASGGKDCIHVTFQGSEYPYFAYGRAYMRVGDEDRKLSAKELENLFLMKNESNLRWDNKYSSVGVSEIDEALLKKYVGRGRSAGRINFDFKDVRTTLRKLKLIADNRILNAAEVLFCEDNSLEVQAAVFAGTDKTTFLDIKVFRGTLFDILRQCELYISERMNWRVEFKDFKRVEIPEIPVDAIREALVNSLCHRDYFRAESNKVAIFKDRIKIYNPGEFTARFEPSDYIHGDAESVQRNPLIS
ncbi:MAG: putative DNA binding domain-containing protein, partial [Methanosarcinales archaeon]|nr:putative DNA binding domain-containing protein [Methanosarcinales archaeon]